MKILYLYIKNKYKSTVFKNIASLSLIKFTTYIFPLFTVPYISRIFGPDIYGLVNFAYSIISYFLLLINYGFDFTATREIAQNRGDLKKIEIIFNKVLLAKLLLFIISIIIFIILLFTVKKINEYKVLYSIIFIGLIFQIFYPTWFFQGMEKLTYTAIFTFIIKLVFTGLIFILIKSKNDYLYYPISIIIGQFIVAITSLIIIKNNYNIKFKILPFPIIIKTLRNGWQIFLTTVVVHFYTATNLIILGFLGTNYDVGIYSAAYKIVIITSSLINVPFNLSIYPNIGRSFSISFKEGMEKISKILLIVPIIIFIPSIVIFLFPSIFIHILYGVKFNDSITTLRILAFLPFIIIFSNIFGLHGLLNIKKDEEVTKVTVIGSIIGLSLNFILVPIYKFNGTAYSWLITEIVITIIMFIKFQKNTNFLFYFKPILIKYLSYIKGDKVV